MAGNSFQLTNGASKAAADTSATAREFLHGYYTIPLGFSPQLVASIIEKLGVKPNHTVLDPFCGTGTTLLEAKAKDIRAIGIDANPVCALASRAKSNWNIDVDSVNKALTTVLKESKCEFGKFLRRYRNARSRGQRISPLAHSLFLSTKEGRYLRASGLLTRGWISARPALKSLILSRAISKVRNPKVRAFMMVGFMGVLVREISNVRFGPEAYTAEPRGDVNVFAIYGEHVECALEAIASLQAAKSTNRHVVVLTGDSMNGGITKLRASSIDFVITSPPYPAEHDYTRNTRLELVYGRFVTKLADLVRIKRNMIRSSSKSIYKDDNLSSQVTKFRPIRNLIKRIQAKSRSKSHGFARKYPRLVGEYFGGMYVHLKRLKRVLKPGARCAYVLGDQASFFGTPIRTAKLLATLVKSKKCEFAVESVTVLRRRRATRGSHKGPLPEHLLIFRKKGRRGSRHYER